MSAVRAPVPHCLGDFAGETLPVPKDVCGVYFLVHFDVVMYVGQSTGVIHRCGRHAAKYPHLRMYYIPVPRGKLNATEMEFIHLFKPAMNCQYKRQREIDRMVAFGRLLNRRSPQRKAGAA